MINRWKLIHTYYSLADQDRAKYLICTDDSARLNTVIDPSDADPTPVLWCPECDVTIRPGLDLWQQIENVVLEHYDRKLFE